MSHTDYYIVCKCGAILWKCKTVDDWETRVFGKKAPAEYRVTEVKA